jgi:hypothetical protein
MLLTPKNLSDRLFIAHKKEVVIMKSTDQLVERPFFLDFAFRLPPGVEIETSKQVKDCTSWGEASCDDD